MSRLATYLKSLRSNQFLRQNAVFFAGSLAVSVLNYLYYPVLGRLLPSAQFGEVQAIVSLFLQTTIFLSVVTFVAVNVVSNEPDADKRSRTVYELGRLAALVMGGGLLLALIFLPQIQHFLRFEHPVPFLILGVSLALSVPLAVLTAYIRGMNAFGRLSLNNMISAGVKLAASALFVVLGWSTSGAIGGLVAAQLVALVFAVRWARQLGLRPRDRPWLRWPDLAVIKPQLPYAGLVLVVSLVTTMQFSFDILVVKHFFPPQTAGDYAGIATIARIIYFLTGSVAGVLLTTVKRSATPAANRGLLKRSMLLQAGLGGAALLVFVAVPGLITQILIGARYLPLSGLLPELSFALFVIAFINLFLTYDLALRRASAALVAVAGAAATFALVAFNHGSPAAVVRSILIGSVIMLGLRALMSVYRRLRPAPSA